MTSERDSALRDRTEALAQAQEREMKLETKSQEAETLRKERTDAQAQVQEQLTKLETLNKELEGLRVERTETGSRVQSLEGDLDQLRRERTELVAQAQECTIKVETREKDLEGLKKELERQREKEELLAKSSKEGEQTMTQLQTQLWVETREECGLFSKLSHVIVLLANVPSFLHLFKCKFNFGFDYKKEIFVFQSESCRLQIAGS